MTKKILSRKYYYIIILILLTGMTQAGILEDIYNFFMSNENNITGSVTSFNIESSRASWKTIKCTGLECLNITTEIKSDGTNCNVTYKPKYKSYWSSTDWAIMDLKFYMANSTNIKKDVTSQAILNKTGNGANTKIYSVLLDCKTAKLIQIGNSTRVDIYENDTKVVYTEEDYNYQINATLQKWNGFEYVLAPQDIFINDTNQERLKYGAYDINPFNVTNNSLNKYKYIWDSTQILFYDEDRKQYYIYEGIETINKFYSQERKRYIDTSDVCSDSIHICIYTLSEDRLRLEMTFNAKNINNVVFIDPAYTETYWASTYGYFTNTGASAQGINLTSTNKYGNYTNFVYYNESSNCWNATFTATGLNATDNITLYTRVAESYNTSDIYLKAFWAFNNVSGENNTLFKDELNILNATCTACPNSTINGTVHRALSFNGIPTTGSFITVADDDRLSATNGSKDRPFTLSFWIRPQSSISDKSSISKTGALANSREWYIYHPNSAGTDLHCLYLYAWNNTNTRQCYRSNLASNRWYHFVYSYDGRGGVNACFGINITFNGVPYKVWNATSGCVTGSYSYMADTTQRLTIGRSDITAATTFINASIDEVRIYNRTLNWTESIDLYNLGKYHINWQGDNENWTKQDLLVNNTPQTSNGTGKFFQFRAEFRANNGAGNGRQYLKTQSITEIGNCLGVIPDLCNSYTGSGNWLIPCGCNITSNTNMFKNNFTINGSGETHFKANVTNFTSFYIYGCTVRCYDGNCWSMKE